MKPSYESAVALVSRATGPLSGHLGGFVAWLIDQQYAASGVHIKARHAVSFDRWLANHGITLIELGDIHIERYQRRRRRRHRCIRAETRRIERDAISSLLRFLRHRGVCEPARIDATPADVLAGSFGEHLQNHQGSAPTTVECYTTVAREFLAECFGHDRVDLRLLRAADVIEFVQRRTKRMQPPALKRVVTGMRAFLRYAQYRGEVAPGLVAAVPSVATWTTTPQLPKAISPAHAQCAIGSCDLGTAIGRRDRAVLLLLARLGLRACEIIALRLEDCDWDTGHLRVRGKGGRECLLPMPTDVGEAIAAYLECGRPTSTDRHLFLRSMAPIRGLREVGSIVRYALRRGQVNSAHRGSHQFRHALAVRMLRIGASLPEIGEVLRHRSPQSTSIYARVDIESLRALALPWPGGAR